MAALRVVGQVSGAYRLRAVRRAVRRHLPDAVWHPAMARSPAVLSPCQGSGDCVCPVLPRFPRTAPVPRPWGFGGAPRGTAVPLSSGRGVQATSADAFRGQPPQAALRPRRDRSPAKFLWYRQRHLSFQRKVGLRECALRTILATDIPALRTMQFSVTAARGGTFDRAKVPKARWGVANAPQTPVARSLGAKTCGFLPCRGRQYPSFPCGGRGTRVLRLRREASPLGRARDGGCPQRAWRRWVYTVP